MLTADQPWDPSTINDDLDGQVVYPDDDDVLDDDMRAFVFQACQDVNTVDSIDKQHMEKALSYLGSISKTSVSTTTPDTDVFQIPSKSRLAPP